MLSLLFKFRRSVFLGGRALGNRKDWLIEHAQAGEEAARRGQRVFLSAGRVFLARPLLGRSLGRQLPSRIALCALPTACGERSVLREAALDTPRQIHDSRHVLKGATENIASLGHCHQDRGRMG